MSNRGRPVRKPTLALDEEEEDDVPSLPQPKKDVPQFKKRKKLGMKPVTPNSQIEKPKPTITKPISVLDVCLSVLKSSLLKDEDEEEQDTFTIRKSKESRKAKKEEKVAKFKRYERM